MIIRDARSADVAGMARIFNAAIDERIATFETRSRAAGELEAWLGGRHPVVVAEEAGTVVGFARASAYRDRECYAGIAEVSVYVDAAARGRGIGRALLDALAGRASARGFWKLLSRIFIENTPSRRAVAAAGYREVGVYERHGRLDGRWRDVVIVECLLADETGVR